MNRKSRLKEEFSEFFLPEHRGLLHLFERNGEAFLTVEPTFNINRTTNAYTYAIRNDHLEEYLGNFPLSFGENSGQAQLDKLFFSSEDRALLSVLGCKPSIAFDNTLWAKFYVESGFTNRTIYDGKNFGYGSFRLLLTPNKYSNTFAEDVELCKNILTVIELDKKLNLFFVKH